MNSKTGQTSLTQARLLKLVFIGSIGDRVYRHAFSRLNGDDFPSMSFSPLYSKFAGLCLIARIQRDIGLPPFPKSLCECIRVHLNVVGFRFADMLITVRSDQSCPEQGVKQSPVTTREQYR